MASEGTLSVLQNVATFGLGSDPLDNREVMERAMNRAEQEVNENSSALFLYWLGIAYRNYTAWYIRGDDRQPYMTKAVHYFRGSLKKAKQNLPVENHDSDINSLGQLEVAGELGRMLVKDKPVRDLDEAEQVLTFVYENASDYEPSLCMLIDLYYFKGAYEKSAEIARSLVEIQKHSTEWKDSPAPYPAMAEAKAYRALRNDGKKQGDIASAKVWSKKLVATGYATDNDKKIHAKL